MTKAESKFQTFLAAKKAEVAEGAPEGPVMKVGRPAGKRSDAAFEQVTAYIRKSTHNEVKIALLREGKKRQFSDLVEQLLGEWVRSNK